MTLYFDLEGQGSSIQTEFLAGFSTFLTMAYIIVVNPAILADAGMDFGAVFVATCLAAAFGSLAMGLFANYPIALAPGMGLNAFFAYGVVIGTGHSWQAAMGATFIAGMLFLALSVLPIREWLINAIPKSLKLGIASGIGMFLGVIGLKNAGIIVASPATLVALGDITQPEPVLALAGLILIVSLTCRKVPGAVIIGVLAATFAGLLLGVAEFHGIAATPPSIMPVLLQLDIGAALEWSMLSVILSFLLVDIFDTAGTLLGVSHRAGLLDGEGRLPRLRQALLADSSATAVSGLLGTSPTTSYIESATGVEAGGRTGLTAVAVGLLFLLCLFFAPLAQSVPAYASAAALLFVACLMLRSLAEMEWDDLSTAAPAVVTTLGIPLTFSIADGIGLGFISYSGIAVLSGGIRTCPAAVHVLALIFALKYLFL